MELACNIFAIMFDIGKAETIRYPGTRAAETPGKTVASLGPRMGAENDQSRQLRRFDRESIGVAESSMHDSGNNTAKHHDPRG